VNKRFDELTESQREAVFHFDGPLLVVAGPGSGKTRVITYRIAAMVEAGIAQQNICAITFTNKAAEEMRTRCSQLLGPVNRAQISTFHSLCTKILRQYAAQAGIKANFSIYDTTDQLKCIKQAIKEAEIESANFPPGRMLEAVSQLKNRLIDVPDLENKADDFFSKKLVKIYTNYQRLLFEANALDFDDLLLRTANLLKNNPDVCGELSNRYKFLLIDEYQDTNHAQYQIAKMLVSRHNNICATGDPDQSIYRWRGADIRNILDFEKDWPQSRVIKLEENFRSTRKILEAADRLISRNKSRKPKVLIPTRSVGSEIIIDCSESEQQEAENVAGQIQSIVRRGEPLRNIAVFYRINSMSRPIEEALIRGKIPYQIIRGIEFYNRKEIRDLLAYLKILVNPDYEIAVERIINVPPRGIGKTTVERIKQYAGRGKQTLYEGLKDAGRIEGISAGTRAKIAVFVNMIEELKKNLSGPVWEIVKNVSEKTGLVEFYRQSGDDESVENIEELINAAANYDKQAEDASLMEFLQQISLVSDVDKYDTQRDCVALMTLHAAKGLEFENVFIVGLEEGILPHERSGDDEAEIEEERRLLFVGITRAKSNLFISLSQYRTVRGHTLRTIPSPFLFELGVNLDSSSQEKSDEGTITEKIVYDEDDSFEPLYFSGQKVRHKTFGVGQIKEFIDMGENSIVIVRFNNGQTKTLKVKYANLSFD
jgi:DNA helicase-2/ATP-dependent DNA helicase PcrA